MSIWNKILIGFIFIASVVFLWLGAKALKTHQYWRTIAAKQEQQLKLEKDRRDLLVNGKDGEMGIRQAMLALHKQLVDRGRVWRGATPQKVNVDKDAQGFATVGILLQMDVPDPHRIEKDANLVLFEEKDVQEKGSYLGRFTVVGVAGKQIELKPSLRLTDREIKRLQASRDKWCAYEIMPIDDHEVFVGYADLDKIIPQESLPEYAKDGQAEDPNNKDAAKLERKLRDYELLFTVAHEQQSVWLQQMDAARRDQQSVEAGVELAKKEVEACQKDVSKFKDEMAQLARQRDAVAAHRKAVEAKLAEVQKAMTETMAHNRELVGEIARIQLDATRKIDARTERMAQLTPAQ
jgi:hypothetical protein